MLREEFPWRPQLKTLKLRDISFIRPSSGGTVLEIAARKDYGNAGVDTGWGDGTGMESFSDLQPISGDWQLLTSAVHCAGVVIHEAACAAGSTLAGSLPWSPPSECLCFSDVQVQVLDFCVSV